MDEFRSRINKFIANPHVRYGSSFLTFIFLSWVGLTEFARVRYDYKKIRGNADKIDENIKEWGLNRKPRQSLEEIYVETVEKENLDEWFNVRGPRPDENSKTMQEEQRRDRFKS